MVALTVALATSVPCAAQLPEFCVAQRGNGAGPESYRVRSGGKYCDGIVFERHASTGLLAVLAVATGADGEAPPEGTVGVLATENVAGPIRLQGLALDAKQNYRLDAELRGDTRLRLGPESGLSRAAEVSFDGVGWLAWVDSPRGVRYLPTLDRRLGSEEISITVRPASHSDFVVYSARDAAGGEVIALSEAARDVRANENVVFAVPARGASPLFVEVLAIGKAGGTELADLAIERRRGDDGG